MKIVNKLKNFWNDYFSITRFCRGFRSGFNEGLENGGIVCQQALKNNNEEWKVEIRRIIPTIPITKGLADGKEIRNKLKNLLEK